MGWSFGNIFRDAAQTFPGAFARSQEIEANRPQRELAELQVEKLRQELDNNAKLEKDIQEFIQKGPGKQITGKGQAVQAWRKFYPIAALPPGKARKIPVQAFARQSEAKARVVPSKSFTDFLMGADQETLKTFFEETENELLAMPDSDPKKLMSVISDDAASAEAITKTQVKVEAQRAAVEKKAGEAGNGGELTPVESLQAKDRARLQKVNARWRASKQAYDGIQTFAAQLSAKGYDPEMIRSRIGPQLEKSKAEFDRLDKMREELRGNVRESQKESSSFQSTAGKLGSDLEKAISTFGKDSQQVAVIRQAMEQEQKGGASAYAPAFQFIPGQNGQIMVGNVRSGELTPGVIGGQPAIAASADPETQGNIASAKAGAELETKREFNMAGVNDAVAEARRILTDEGPTASGFGANVDKVAAYFGIDSSSANAAQKLEVVGGQLLSKVPRFEGQQSNIDVQIYQQMAGQVADRTLPVERRLAALDAVSKMWGQFDKTGTSLPIVTSASEFAAVPEGSMFYYRKPDGTMETRTKKAKKK